MQTTSVLVTGKYSGYKLKNLCKKPQVLTFRFMPSKQLMERHHFNWHQSQLKYLGVLLTKNLSQLYNVNYKLINKKIYDGKERWKDIELSLMETPILSALGCPGRFNDVHQLHNHCTSFSLKMWSDVVKKYQLCREIGALILSAFHPHFPPALQDHRYKQWTKRGIASFCRIIKNGNLNSFEDLRQSYDLGKEDFYRYLQNFFFFKV